MRLEFSAEEAEFADENDPTYFCLLCGFYGKDSEGVDHYLTFQRAFEEEPASDDWGVHCEFDDQINGNYNCIGCCRLTRTALEVEFTKPIDWEKKYGEIVVNISGLSEQTFAAIRAGLPRIFRGATELLTLV
jgi:hypothetical protein